MAFFVRFLLFAAVSLPVTVLAAPSLDDHPSPYLRLHADDPVRWQSWNPGILSQAQADNRLIFLSIGYFSCHWCHVMQRESFQDEILGNYVNQNFVPVKIDRELRPDLDRRMLEFVRVIEGRAGWPLNVFLTPDGYPLTGFNYQSRDDFLNSLTSLQAQWVERSEQLANSARAVFRQTESLRVSEPVPTKKEAAELVDLLLADVEQQADVLQGGFGSTRKFPAYPKMKSLLDLLHSDPQRYPELEEFVLLTLDNMARYHLRDHVNGGFFRYTTDPDWQTPHFEKMLYDNAHQVLLYLQAHAQWPGRGYAEVARDTLAFINRELRDSRGGFYSSLSAVGNDGEEGAAYRWTRAELARLLSTEDLAMLTASGIAPATENGPFQLGSLQPLPGRHRVRLRQQLQQARANDIPVDQKKLASWNAIMLSALLQAEEQWPQSGAVQRTDQHYQFIREAFLAGERVRRSAGAPSTHETTLEDYAYVANALAEYALQRDDAIVATQAAQLIERALVNFLESDRWQRVGSGLLPGDDGSWIIEDRELRSSSVVLLEAVRKLETVDADTRARAERLVHRLSQRLLEKPLEYASHIALQVAQ